jgi:hypothetical protein
MCEKVWVPFLEPRIRRRSQILMSGQNTTILSTFPLKNSGNDRSAIPTTPKCCANRLGMIWVMTANKQRLFVFIPLFAASLSVPCGIASSSTAPLQHVPYHDNQSIPHGSRDSTGIRIGMIRILLKERQLLLLLLSPCIWNVTIILSSPPQFECHRLQPISFIGKTKDNCSKICIRRVVTVMKRKRAQGKSVWFMHYWHIGVQASV